MFKFVSPAIKAFRKHWRAFCAQPYFKAKLAAVATAAVFSDPVLENHIYQQADRASEHHEGGTDFHLIYNWRTGDYALEEHKPEYRHNYVHVYFFNIGIPNSAYEFRKDFSNAGGPLYTNPVNLNIPSASAVFEQARGTACGIAGRMAAVPEQSDLKVLGVDVPFFSTNTHPIRYKGQKFLERHCQ